MAILDLRPVEVRKNQTMRRTYRTEIARRIQNHHRPCDHTAGFDSGLAELSKNISIFSSHILGHANSSIR